MMLTEEYAPDGADMGFEMFPEKSATPFGFEKERLSIGPLAAPPRLIALCSPCMGSGKSALARFLVEDHNFAPLKFAGVLKNMIRTLLAETGFVPTEIERMVDGDLKEVVIPEIGVTPRWMQQSIGTEWGRNCIRQDLWVHLTRIAAVRLLDQGVSVVIDDMRFINELEMVREIGGYAIRVVRPGIESTTAAHPSEGALDTVSMLRVSNDADLDALRDRAKTLATCALR